MFIVNLRKTNIINVDHCLSIKQDDRRIMAFTLKNHPDCPYAIPIAEYSTKEKAKKVFQELLLAMDDDEKIFYMPDEKQAGK